MILYYLGNILSLSALYMTSGVGNAICLKAGKLNLGGEGQIFAGGFICAILLNFFGSKNFPAFVALFLAFFFAALVSGLFSLFSVILEKYRDASFLLTSFIFSAAIIPLINGLISGPFKGNSGNLIGTDFILNKYRFLKVLPPSSFSLYFCVAIVFCVLGSFLLKTEFGKEIEVFGKAKEFALYTGVSEKAVAFAAASISGGLNGIAGAAAICGSFFFCSPDFYVGMGWNALAVAMIARLNPVFIIPSSVFMSALVTMADQYALFHNFDFDISGLIQAIIIFLVSFPFFQGGKNKC